MENVKFVEVTDPRTSEITEHAIVDLGDNKFSSMLKSTYEAMQAEQSTPIIGEHLIKIVSD